ncbi:MAG: hypothetical protein QNJ91_17185 [Gammaproteobacteria bacterium]|nr:hypothetical protein [Gammaproteobacteria bacterium]
MSLSKHGVVVTCEHCRFVAEDRHGGFEVIVPLHDTRSGTAGSATLQCRVERERHAVELARWVDAAGRPARVPDDAATRARAALAYVAERRVCGNRGLCPPQVVDVVARHSGD